MKKNLITTFKILIIILVVIAVLAGLYYLISPYENCMRRAADETNDFASFDKQMKTGIMIMCADRNPW
tara:strand:- start:53 stop:256 length:204 start_codon:yes stop_codon:yes gene_type:complete